MQMPRASVGLVATKGRVTIPNEIRDLLDLKEEERVIFTAGNGQAAIRKATRKRLADILRSQEPWKENGAMLQERLRNEWK